MSANTKLLASLATLAVVAGLVGLFAVDVGSTSPGPVDVDNTVSMGIDLDDAGADLERSQVPVVQVTYSQYPYVVSYYGVESFIHEQRQDGHTQRFGYPLAIYVNDYSATTVELSEAGVPVAISPTPWIRAEDAVYVVGSDASLQSGDTAVPFSDPDAARSFADEHGGEVLAWQAVTNTDFEVDDAETVRERVGERHREADALVEASESMLDRPTSVVVGVDAESIQAAVDEAPSETTVVVPAGFHEETVTIDRPITLRGEDEAKIQAGGNGTPITVTADDVAITGFDVAGVGNETPDGLVGHGHGGHGGGHDHADHGDGGATDEDGIDDAAQTDSETDSVDDTDAIDGDAGIAVVGSRGVLVSNVEIETPSAGIALRDSPGAVVRTVTVEGHDDWREGHMGVLALRAPGVIEDSTFRDGRDSIYTHRASGMVVRNNTMDGGRIGIHFMHTSRALIAENTFSGQESAGIDVMTGPEHNAIVGNDVRGVPTGIDQGGTGSYVARNVLVDNRVGLETDAAGSIYEHNVFAGNDVGVQSRTLMPSNRVVNNDFVDNERHATARIGPHRVWSHDGAGNYWEGAVGTPGGDTLDRPYTATHPVDGALHRVDGTPTLARAPALDALAGLEGSIPGMRTGHIVDTAPRIEPVAEAWFEGIEWSDSVTDYPGNETDRNHGEVTP